MVKLRIIIADTDVNYILPLQFKFVADFFDKVDLEIITDKNYFNTLFSFPQKADVLVISEDMYDISLQRHNIGNIFLMTEHDEDNQNDDQNVNRVFKYTSIKEIFNQIIGKSEILPKVSAYEKKETQIILVYSACGGVGKTTIALGAAACLTENYKRVLYINAGRLQSFQRMFENRTVIMEADVYAKLADPGYNTYRDIRSSIRQEMFYYLPLLKASLVSLGVDYSIYEIIAQGAKGSAEFDYIIVDADSSFGEAEASLINIADKVVIVTRQNENSVFTTNLLVDNISDISSEKYIFVCNDFDKESENAIISAHIPTKFAVSEYVEHIFNYDKLTASDLAKEGGLQRVALLMI
ncbi:MAG: AAA family ATPase [Oscillospiraceae bacterium]|nr:AAA family ATPase [Oscillospiraceae bacterium]